MPRRMYPLNALRAFEASARQLSFVRASEELSVTPAAVSHQVKGLEEYLGQPLFRRLPRGLLLTESGQLLLPELSDVFLRLDKAMERVIESDSRGTITLSVAPTFAVMWLIPRLQKFYTLNPVSMYEYQPASVWSTFSAMTMTPRSDLAAESGLVWKRSNFSTNR